MVAHYIVAAAGSLLLGGLAAGLAVDQGLYCHRRNVEPPVPRTRFPLRTEIFAIVPTNSDTILPDLSEGRGRRHLRCWTVFGTGAPEGLERTSIEDGRVGGTG